MVSVMCNGIFSDWGIGYGSGVTGKGGKQVQMGRVFIQTLHASASVDKGILPSIPHGISRMLDESLCCCPTSKEFSFGASTCTKTCILFRAHEALSQGFEISGANSFNIHANICAVKGHTQTISRMAYIKVLQIALGLTVGTIFKNDGFGGGSASPGQFLAQQSAGDGVIATTAGGFCKLLLR